MGEHVDPYRAPASDSAIEPDARDALALPAAGRWRRFFTFLLDYAGQSLLIFLVTVAIVIADPSVVEAIDAMTRPMEWGIGLAALLVYYIGFEGLFGRTPGKWICGTRVVDLHGAPPDFKQAVLRTISRLVPFEGLSLLFSDDKDPSAWHDRWARTRVVKVR